jgi:hypothetical protein
MMHGSPVFEEWQASFEEIRRHDEACWKGREIPDPQELFGDFWQWRRTSGTDPERDDPLEVFSEYWSEVNKK